MKLLKNTGPLPLCHLDDFVLGSKAAENPHLALRDTKMLGQQLDNCLIGSALPCGFLDFDYEAVCVLADFLSF